MSLDHDVYKKWAAMLNFSFYFLCLLAIFVLFLFLFWGGPII